MKRRSKRIRKIQSYLIDNHLKTLGRYEEEGKFSIDRDFLYKLVNLFLKELVNQNIISIIHRGSRTHLYVVSLEALYKFFEQKGIIIYPKEKKDLQTDLQTVGQECFTNG